MRCPCGSGGALDDCCGPYLSGQSQAPTAEALMRSRYSAHVTRDVDHLVRTHAPDRGRPNPREIRRWAESNVWLGLEVRRTERGGEGDDHGLVEFVARHDPGDGPRAHHEISTFARRDGAWLYVFGAPGPKPSRNEPCLCGSGRKYKRCCGGTARS